MTTSTPYISPDQGGRRCSDRETQLLNELDFERKISVGLLATIDRLERDLAEFTHHAWAIQGSAIMWKGEHAELDSTSEARRCGGTCYAYPVFTKELK
jgi:hypothetical protein